MARNQKVCFFGANFDNLEGKKGTENVFFWEKTGPSFHIRRKENLRWPYLENSFQQVPKS